MKLESRHSTLSMLTNLLQNVFSKTIKESRLLNTFNPPDMFIIKTNKKDIYLNPCVFLLRLSFHFSRWAWTLWQGNVDLTHLPGNYWEHCGIMALQCGRCLTSYNL